MGGGERGVRVCFHRSHIIRTKIRNGGGGAFRDQALSLWSHVPVSSVPKTPSCSGSLPTLGKRRPHRIPPTPAGGAGVSLEYV